MRRRSAFSASVGRSNSPHHDLRLRHAVAEAVVEECCQGCRTAGKVKALLDDILIAQVLDRSGRLIDAKAGPNRDLRDGCRRKRYEGDTLPAMRSVVFEGPMGVTVTTGEVARRHAHANIRIRILRRD